MNIIIILASQGNSVADNAPIGTIWPYVGDIANIPEGWHLCDGTDGTPNLLDNRFLEGSAVPGQFIEAGLPNIVGSIDTDGAGALSLTRPTKGNAFYPFQSRYKTAFWAVESEYVYRGIIMDASLCSEIYGASDTVQPRSYTVYFIMKMK